jgi:hypothetical protein
MKDGEEKNIDLVHVVKKTLDVRECQVLFDLFWHFL